MDDDDVWAVDTGTFGGLIMIPLSKPHFVLTSRGEGDLSKLLLLIVDEDEGE